MQRQLDLLQPIHDRAQQWHDEQYARATAAVQANEQPPVLPSTAVQSNEQPPVHAHVQAPMQAPEQAHIPQVIEQPPVLPMPAAEVVQQLLDQYLLQPVAVNDQAAQTNDEEVPTARWNEVT